MDGWREDLKVIKPGDWRLGTVMDDPRSDFGRQIDRIEAKLDKIISRLFSPEELAKEAEQE